MPSTNTSAEAGTLAEELYEELKSDLNDDLPEIDWDNEDFRLPDLTADPIDPLTEADLTTREVCGTGLFDGLMQAIKGHLHEEYKANRITGTQYSEAYVQMVSTAMGNAVQYLLQKDTARWQAMLVQQQALAAKVGVITAKVGLEDAKVRLAMARIQTETAQGELSLTKLKLASEDAGWMLAKTQLKKAEYELANLLPKQAAGLDADNAIKVEQRNQLAYEVANILPLQSLKLEAEHSMMTYQLDNILPAQKAKLEGEVSIDEFQLTNMLPAQQAGILADNEIKDGQFDKITYELTTLLPLQAAGLTADNEGKVYTNTNILPAQKAKLEGEVSIDQFQLTQMLPAQRSGVLADNEIKDAQLDKLTYEFNTLLPLQAAGLTADNTSKTYTNANILPEQLEALKENVEANRAKTLNTRRDGQLITGLSGAQVDLYEQQVTSYKRDAETKAVKMLLDSWVTQKTMDSDFPAPSSFNETSINSAFAALRTNLDL